MRLFVAVDVDRSTREAARALRSRLQRDRPSVERALRWVDPDKLHLTLLFIGERDTSDDIGRALDAGPPGRRFRLTWGVPGWLPPVGRPRVFHVAVRDGEAALTELAREVTDRLRPIGVRPDDRPFKAHLTLARVRDGADPGVLRQLGTLVPAEPFAPDIEVTVDAVVLYQSDLSPRGPAYEVRRRVALT